MAPPFPIPTDVRRYVHDVFLEADRRVSTALDNIPNTHEESLDFLLISAVAERSTPFRTASNYIINFGLHFLGGGHHHGRWEIADIGVVVNYFRGGKRVRTKVVLLQSKRLYPREVDFVEVDPIVKPGGFGYMALPPVLPAEHARSFTFDETCRYSALQVGDPQWQRIAEYELQHGTPIHYLFYHPRSFPYVQNVPLTRESWRGVDAPIDLGSRVIRAEALRAATMGATRNTAPSLDDLRVGLGDAGLQTPGFGWPLGRFISEQVIDCNEGYVAENLADQNLTVLFNQRSGPIAAAFRIDINAPADIEELDAPAD